MTVVAVLLLTSFALTVTALWWHERSYSRGLERRLDKAFAGWQATIDLWRANNR